MRKVIYILTILLLLPACSTKEGKEYKRILQMEKAFTEAMQATSHSRVKELLEKGVDPNLTTGEGWNALHYGAFWGRIDIVKLALSKGTNPNHKDQKGITPVHSSAMYGNIEVIALLVAKGAVVNSRDDDGRTPVWFAAANGHADALKYLIEKGAKRSALCLAYQGHTVLHLLAGNAPWPLEQTGRTSKYLEVASLAIDAGAKLNAKRPNNQTPLHVASTWGFEQMAELLLRKGANVDAEDNCKRTPLHIAVKNDNCKMAEILLYERAWVNAADKEENTPLDCATSEEMERLLRGHGAVSGKELKQGEEK